MGKHWALIVSGTDEWSDYRHEANSCHAFQVVKKHGVPLDNVVFMLYDNIARNLKNPTTGLILNKVYGHDVYAGVKIDYKSTFVSAKNFLAILRGDKAYMKGKGTGRVIESGPDDNIFVAYSDHGAPGGILSFPRDLLYPKTFIDTILKMQKNNQFSKMVLYINACYSGAVFSATLPATVKNVYAATATKPDEPGYACYYDTTRKVYLGSEFAVAWAEDSDVKNLNTWTLQEQFNVIRSKVLKSTPMQYGDRTMTSRKVGEFQGNTVAAPAEGQMAMQEEFQTAMDEDLPVDLAPEDDIAMETLRKLHDAETEWEKKEVIRHQALALKERRNRIDATMSRIVERALRGTSIVAKDILEERRVATDQEAYETVVKKLDETCFRLPNDEYALAKLQILLNLCEEDGMSVGTIMEAIEYAAALH